MTASPDLQPFIDLIAADHGLAVLSVAGPDGRVHSSVVNAGVLDHPTSGTKVVGVVVAGAARKLTLLRDHPRAAATLRGGWRWASVEGPVELIGPDDPHPGIDADGLRRLLRAVFTSAGGTHDDWNTYDEVMRDERRTAVLISPETIHAV